MIAEYSFLIYVSHDFVQTMFKKVTAKVIIQTDTVQMIEYFLIPVLVCAVCIGVSALLKKIVPVIYNILTGSRMQGA